LFHWDFIFYIFFPFSEFPIKTFWVWSSHRIKNISLLVNNILNEYILEGKTILIPILCKLFNVILCTSRFPELWVKSVIVPLFYIFFPFSEFPIKTFWVWSSHRIKNISLLVLIKSFQFIFQTFILLFYFKPKTFLWEIQKTEKKCKK
jgi:heme exporter protein D